MCYRKTIMLSVGILVSVSITQRLARGQESPRFAMRSGDVNGDGAVDISDAIYLINWQFSGGPRPVELTCPESRTTESDVKPFYDREITVGSSKLIRDPAGLTLSFDTSDIISGHTYTVWWVIFNNPEACEDGCNGPDLRNPEVQGDLLVADGDLAGEEERLHFAARLEVGNISGSIAMERLGVDSVGVVNPLGAEVHVILRSHGPAIPAETADQIHTFNGGCTVFPPRPEIPDEAGECTDVQFAVHLP